MTSAAATISLAALIINAVLITCAANEIPNDVATILYGPSQSAKSTLACALSRVSNPHADCPETGDGSGISVTDTAQLYSLEGVGLTVDTPGNDDTQMRSTNEEAGVKTALAVAKTDVKKVRFAIFESLATDRRELNRTLVSFKVAFGADAISASILVATKSDCCNTAIVEKRLARIRDIMQVHKISTLVVLGDEALIAEESFKLADALKNVQPIATKELQNLRDRQRARAQQICDHHPTQKKEIEVPVEEQYTVPREEQEEYQEPYTYHKTCTERYEENVPYTIERKCGGRRYGLFGPRDTCTDVRYRTEMKERSYSCPETGQRTAYRIKVVYDVFSRTKMEKRIIDYRLPMEEFMAEALEDIMKEMRGTLRAEL